LLELRRRPRPGARSSQRLRQCTASRPRRRARSRPPRSVAGVPLFLPRISVEVVAVRLPDPGSSSSRSSRPAHPLRALPEVQMRDKQARGPPVLGVEGLAVVGEGHPRLPAGQILDRQVGRVAAVAERERVRRVMVEAVEERVDGDALPRRVELRPPRDAVMSVVTDSAGSAWKSSQLQLFLSSPATTENVQSSTGMCGVGPADRTGKSSVTYWPGGRRSGSASRRRRPRKSRETGIVSSFQSGLTLRREAQHCHRQMR